MSRSPTSWKALAFVMMLFASLFICETVAKYIKPKSSEYDLHLPLACPDLCGKWCDTCPGGSGKLINTNDGGYIIFPRFGDVTTQDTYELGVENMADSDDPGSTVPKLPDSPPFQRHNDEDIFTGNLSHPETWGAGPASWWSKMNGIIDRSGLVLDNTPRSSAMVAYLDMDEFDAANRFPEASQAGGAPSLRGSTLFVAASNLGIYIGHFWESPTFVAIRSGFYGQASQFDEDRQESSWQRQVFDFLRYGTHDFHNATAIHEDYKRSPNSPSLEDLIRPGMILDPASTEWRQFRLFQPRDPHRGPPGTVPKNEEIMNQLRGYLSSLLKVDPTEIVRHDPFYEPNSVVQGGPYKPTPWHNMFTWQYGPPRSSPFDDMYWMAADEVRQFHATFNGEPIVDMSRIWRHTRLPVAHECRLHVTAYAVPATSPDVGNMKLRTRVIQPGEKLVLDETKYFYPVRYEGDGETPAAVHLGKDLTGLGEALDFWYTAKNGDARTPSGQPLYTDWNINFRYGDQKTGLFEYKDTETVVKNADYARCRGGSWQKWGPNAVWQRDSICTFRCTVEFSPRPAKVHEPERPTKQ